MRTIKFRGRRLDNGEWVYGYYFAQGKPRTFGGGHAMTREQRKQYQRKVWIVSILILLFIVIAGLNTWAKAELKDCDRVIAEAHEILNEKGN